ncbi:FAD-dependent oxidoreductase [Amycolatopsis sp. K13G38]|uniref:FAD-dependent oxidoreductase n=1 Tax=Amycolatopsis acididurans TaxID=2724524 RepID=A0ABX1JJF1_9PSEU|nr:FAD-dependent oxidoreductase [Amycolatopsis acididurans]NKQ58959.1 FAD-dependent oxidoreductase [Amycolatopsis acididurans]
MSDRRRVHHPARPGFAHARELDRLPRAVVVGGGIAGLTAATALAERGVAVEVLEREQYWGGRVGGWTTTLSDGTTTGMSRGFHAFFRQYYNLRALLGRAEPELMPLTDYPLVDEHGRTDTFRGIPSTPPWNALGFALRSPTFSVADLFRVNARAALDLVNVTVPGTYERLDAMDAESFLARVRFPEAARHLAFDVFSRSFFAAPQELSAAELAVMFHLYFLGSAEGLLFDVPRAPFHTLWSPLVSHLRGLGAETRTGVAATAIERRAGGFTVHTRDGTHEADAVVLALDLRGLRDLVAASPGLGTEAWRAQIAEQRTAPPFVVRRLWLDRPVRADRHPFLATGGLPPLDNISVLDRYDADAAAWARASGGSVVELHAYASPGEDVPARLLDRLRELYPETRDAKLVDDRVERREDCPLFAPGTYFRRPPVLTPVPGLALAGDGVRADLPVALMERAATTGWLAANHLLGGWGVAGHPLTTVPTSGRLAMFRALAKVM